MTKRLRYGTVSHGTLVAGHLREAFLDELRTVDEDRYGEMVWRDVTCDACRRKRDEPATCGCAAMMVDMLIDVLNEYVPEGAYFGTHPGDGADFGVWRDELREYAATVEQLELSIA